MLLIFGNTERKRKVGDFAMFCPVCRAARIFRAHETISYMQLYFIPISKSEVKSRTLKCSSCPVTYITAEAPRESLRAGRRADPEDYVDHPQIAPRLALEQRMLDDDLAPAERFALLTEPFLALNDLLVAPRSSKHLDRYSVAALTASAVALGAVIYIGIAKSGPWLSVALSLLTVIVVLMIILMITEPRRYTRRKLQPLLVRALQPVLPEVAELQQVLANLARQRAPIAQHIGAQALMEDIIEADERDSRDALLLPGE